MAGKDRNGTGDGKLPCDWSNILNQHGGWLRTIVHARLQDSLAVDDVMQDLAVTVLRRAPPPSDIANLRPWLYRVALNEVRLFRRRAGRQRGMLTRYAESLDREVVLQDPLQWILSKETKTLVRECLAKLSPQDREILHLKHAEHWSYQQIAQHTGLSFDKVVYRLTRARTRLRSQLLARQSDLVLP